jgi:hypothetical protein
MAQSRTEVSGRLRSAIHLATQQAAKPPPQLITAAVQRRPAFELHERPGRTTMVNITCALKAPALVLMTFPLKVSHATSAPRSENIIVAAPRLAHWRLWNCPL